MFSAFRIGDGKEMIEIVKAQPNRAMVIQALEEQFGTIPRGICIGKVGKTQKDRDAFVKLNARSRERDF